MKRRLTPKQREVRARQIKPIRALVIERTTLRMGGETISVPRVRFVERQPDEVRR